MHYSEGDKVVHPQHGVATVRGTETRGGGSPRDYLKLFLAPKGLTIMVPVDSLEEVGIRPLPTKDEAEAILAVLAAPSDVPTAWADRSATTRARLQSTELVEASRVIRDLMRHGTRSGKPLSAAENTTLENCMETVSTQLALALDISQDEALEVIAARVEPVGQEAPARP